MSSETAIIAAEAEFIACPHCRAQLTFCRSRNPFIDACGFESYHLHCHACGTPLGGVIDPADDALLVSPLAA
ncbi:MAG: hypothetical protein P4L80_14235 [Xanthobacteraceae bacterium]|nr:hypothetical protein [Xanthobacteraceae bacterium]